MRRSLVSWISQSWRPHAEFIQSAIARSVSEPRELQQVRAYLHELKFEQSIEDVEDATDLLYFMHRVSYPAESHLEVKVGEFLSSLAPQVCGHHILAIGRRMQEEPSSGPLWSRVVFESRWFINGALAVLETLTLEEHLTTCAAYWRSLLVISHTRRGRQVVSGSFATVAAELAALTAHRIERCVDRSHAVCLCAKLGIFLRGDIFAELRAVILSVTRKDLSADQTVEVADYLTERRGTETACEEWLDALQMALCHQRPSEVGTAHAVGLLRSMAALKDRTVSDMFEELLLRLLPGMSRDEIMSCCESLSTLTGTAPRMRAALRRVLCPETEGQGRGMSSGRGAALWRLRCLSMVAPEEAAELLVRVEKEMGDTATTLSPAETQSLVRVVCSLQTFLPRIVALCKASYLSSSLPSFTQQDSVYMMYVAARTGESVMSPLFREVINRFTAVRKFDRRKTASQQACKLTSEQFEMVLRSLQVVQGGSAISEQRVSTVLRATLERLQSEGSLSTEASIRLLKVLAHSNMSDSSLSMLLLTSVSRSLTCLTSADVAGLCEVLVSLGSRDVLMFRALLNHLAQCNPDRMSVTAVALAARKLKFVSYFQQSNLLQHITSVVEWPVSDIVLIAATCGGKQRASFLALPGADVLTRVPPEDMTTLDLFLLLSIVSERREHLLRLSSVLSKRKPLAPSDIEAEDTLRAITNVVGDKSALAAVCKSAGCSLQTIDETMLMRVLEAVKCAPELPNVFFRVMGKSVLRLANAMAVDNAVLWLELYVKCQIRDDSVGKALLSRARMRSSSCADVTDKSIRKAAAMYGKSYALQCKLKKDKEKPEWRSFEVV